MAYKNKFISNHDTGQSIKFLQVAKDTNGDLLEMETTYQGFSKEPVPHYHPHQEETFTVTKGVLTVRIDGALKTIKAGETLFIPKNKVHAMWNNSENITTVNWKVQPAMDTEYFLETAMGIAADGKLNKKGMPPILQVALMANKFSNEFRLAKPRFEIQKILFGVLSPFARLRGYRPTYRKYLD
jgi:mannose-6-phosphate isomerase-like protein (cupin superfamily)